ncbi:hypothetical protein ACWC9R_07130 [Streptomyces sp. NPDC001219]
MDAALATYCRDISEPKTLRGRMPAYRLYGDDAAHPPGAHPPHFPLTTARDAVG